MPNLSSHRARFHACSPIVIMVIFLLVGVVPAKEEAEILKTITVKSGDTISYLGFKVYGTYNEEIAAKVRASNPRVADINVVYPGQRINFPRLGPSSPEPQALTKKKDLPVVEVEPQQTAKDSEPIQDKAQPRDAYLTYLDGDAKVRRVGSQTWKPIRTNARLVQGDRVRTEEDAKAEIITFDADIIRLSENTELEIDHLQENPVRKTKKKKLFLSLGRMWNRAKTLLHSKSEYTVRTPNAISGIRGTAYNIDVPSEDTSKIKTYSGAVKVWQPQAKEEVPTGWKLSAPTRVSGPRAVSARQWNEILVKINEELLITPQGPQKKSFDPETDEKNDGWVKWNLARDKEFDR